MGLILGLIGMCVASSAIDKITQSKTKQTEINADATMYVAREKTYRDIATTQIQCDAMRDIESMRAQTQVITAGVRTGYYESLFAHQTPQQYIEDNSPVIMPTSTGSKRFCSYCGERLNEGARFCSNCGSQV